ncbi:MAG: transposase, partial [Chitinispirillales bacterium]|nr:transposase [Chitinispirillales bacterium]
MLETELDTALGYGKHAQTDAAKTNYRNGHTRKRLKSTLGEVAVEMPQDRNSTFEPKIVPKHSAN